MPGDVIEGRFRFPKLGRFSGVAGLWGMEGRVTGFASGPAGLDIPSDGRGVDGGVG